MTVFIILYCGLVIFLVNSYGTLKHKIILFGSVVVLSLPIAIYDMARGEIKDSIIQLFFIGYMIQFIVKAVLKNRKDNEQRNSL